MIKVRVIKQQPVSVGVKSEIVNIPQGGGTRYIIGHGLSLTENNTLSVNTVNDFEGDNTLPITAAGVQATVGNIEAILKTI